MPSEVRWFGGELKGLKITSSQSNNIELSYKTAVDYYEPVISGEDYNFDPDTIEAYTLMKKNERLML